MKEHNSINPLISVIVPVYNVEKYLDRCVDSLINQTYKNIEIILVNDGSTDNSPNLCRSIQKRHKNVVVIDQENGGLSSARNTGIRHASGDLIAFVDSDDWIALDTYEYCLKLMKKNNADIVEYNFIMVDSPKPVKQPNERIGIYTGKQILNYYMESTTRTGSYSVCRCLFPRRSFNGICFREGKINEDIDFKYKALSSCKRLVTTNQYKYFYYQSGNSLSLGGLQKRDFDLYDSALELYNLTKDEKYGNIAKLGKVKMARTAFSLLSKIAYCGIADDSIDKNKLVKRLIKEHRENYGVLLLAPIPLSRKILSVLYVVNFNFTEFLINKVRMIADRKSNRN